MPQVEETVQRSEEETSNHSDKETGSNQSAYTTSGDVSPELLPSSGVETTTVPSGNYVQNFSHVLCRILSFNPFLFPERHLISLFDLFILELVCLIHFHLIQKFIHLFNLGEISRYDMNRKFFKQLFIKLNKFY